MRGTSPALPSALVCVPAGQPMPPPPGCHISCLCASPQHVLSSPPGSQGPGLHLQGRGNRIQPGNQARPVSTRHPSLAALGTGVTSPILQMSKLRLRKVLRNCLQVLRLRMAEPSSASSLPKALSAGPGVQFCACAVPGAPSSPLPWDLAPPHTSACPGPRKS